MDDELLTADEVAKILRKPVGTLYYWRSVGRDKAGEPLGPDSIKIGSTVLYRRSEVERFIEAQEAATSAHRRSA